MPTLQEWQQALTVPRQVVVESSPQLIDEVRQRQVTKNADRRARRQVVPSYKTALTGVTQFAPRREVSVVPVYLLHRLGVITTPAIENLADICSGWAYLRYLWAFQIPPATVTRRALRLSDAAKGIDFHQKGLLSDQIGVGMAGVLLGTYLNAPLAADVSVAMNDPAWPIDLEYKSSPDYLFFNNTQTNLFIVECKGTQTSRSSSIDQLRRGTEQVPSLVFTDGRRPPAIVVATLLSTRGTTVLIVDPPGDSDAEEHLEKPERLGKREWRVRNDVEFARATRLISQAKVLSFAGADEAAEHMLERARTLRPRTPTVRARQTRIAENELGRFQGISQRVGIKDRVNIDVFQGVDTTVYEAFLSEDSERADEALRQFSQRTAFASHEVDLTQPVVTSHEGDSVIVRSAGPDGSLLEVTVSEE